MDITQPAADAQGWIGKGKASNEATSLETTDILSAGNDNEH